jgi:hypothetical protein
MKKILLALLCISTFAKAQTTNSSSTNLPTEGFISGYSLEQSPNTNLVLQSVKAIEAQDTEKYKTFYASDAKFHNNAEEENLEQNIAFISALKSNGISVKFERVAPIWEYVHQSKNMNNPNRYVISYQQAIMSKGDKKTKVVLIAVDLMRDGKIKEEWLSYDTKGIMELMK